MALPVKLRSPNSNILSTFAFSICFVLAAVFCLQAISSSLNLLVEQDMPMEMEWMDTENEEEVEEGADECALFHHEDAQDQTILRSQRLDMLHVDQLSTEDPGRITPPPEQFI